jgi:hypothetical protein
MGISLFLVNLHSSIVAISNMHIETARIEHNGSGDALLSHHFWCKVFALDFDLPDTW